MPIGKTFESTDEPLPYLLRVIHDKKLQLPDFQRGWVWDDERIRSLLASVSMSYPIGALMLLERDGAGIRFKTRPIEGVPERPAVNPDELILDGQQRLTSLYQALSRNQPVDTKDSRDKAIKRWYYLDISRALQPGGEREEAIVGLPEDRKEKNFRGELLRDCSTRELECRAELLPLTALFNETERNEWQQEYLRQAGEGGMLERLSRWNLLYETIVRAFQEYRIPVIRMRKETPKEAVCQVFEKVNTGGVALNVFELLTATYAADDFTLRDDWDNRKRRLRRQRVLAGVESTEFLQSVALAATYVRRREALKSGISADSAPAVGCKRKDILELPLESYQSWSEPITEGYEKCGRLLHALKIFSARDIPYDTQLVPLATVMALLGEGADAEGARGLLSRWIWCGVFGELYGSATETRFARDVPELLAWIAEGDEPTTVKDSMFAPARLLTLKTRNSAAYKGLYALLLKKGAQDFRTGETIDDQVYFDERIDVHHIFPQSWCKSNNIEPEYCDSIVNKAPLSAKTNRIIGGNAPSSYLERMQRIAQIAPDRMDAIIRTQGISPSALRNDDFDTFFSQRSAELLVRIEQAMGKPVVRDAVVEDDQASSEFTDEEENMS